MWLLPGADGNPSCNERGNEQVKSGNCFIIAHTFRRPETNKMVVGGGGWGWDGTLAEAPVVFTCRYSRCVVVPMTEGKQPALSFSLHRSERHFMLHFDLIRIK